MHPLLRLLAGTDRRSIGRSDLAAQRALRQPRLLSVLFDGIRSDDPVLRMRCTDAIGKATRTRPSLLKPYRAQLLGRYAAIEQPEVRWHVAAMLGRLQLSARYEACAVKPLLAFTTDQSRIVRTLAMQSLADLALSNPAIQSQVLPRLKELTTTGTPAMRARGRRLLRILEPTAASG